MLNITLVIPSHLAKSTECYQLQHWVFAVTAANPPENLPIKQALLSLREPTISQPKVMCLQTRFDYTKGTGTLSCAAAPPFFSL